MLWLDVMRLLLLLVAGVYYATAYVLKTLAKSKIRNIKCNQIKVYIATEHGRASSLHTTCIMMLSINTMAIIIL